MERRAPAGDHVVRSPTNASAADRPARQRSAGRDPGRRRADPPYRVGPTAERRAQGAGRRRFAVVGLSAPTLAQLRPTDRRSAALRLGTRSSRAAKALLSWRFAWAERGRSASGAAFPSHGLRFRNRLRLSHVSVRLRSAAARWAPHCLAAADSEPNSHRTSGSCRSNGRAAHPLRAQQPSAGLMRSLAWWGTRNRRQRPPPLSMRREALGTRQAGLSPR
jgi:hypothetical protein